MADLKSVTAPCGIDCFNCELFESNCANNPEIVARLSKAMNLPAEKVGCKGCRVQGGCRLHWNNCDTLDCVTAKGVDFCYECSDFPCRKLQPVADEAIRYPHNIKVYNLSRMKSAGIEKWAEEAAEIRRLYFKGKFAVGKGPQS
jgi:hypothetical protein